MSESSISPEDDGIPSYADDESSAYDIGDRPSFEDSPAALPGDEPEALPPEEIGPEEEADLSEQPWNADAADFDHESYVESESGIGVTGDERGVLVDVEPADPSVSSTSLDARAEDADVTLYDVDEPGDPVGRLEETSDPGVGFDSHEVEGLSPEEAAMHTVDDPEQG